MAFEINEIVRCIRMNREQNQILVGKLFKVTSKSESGLHIWVTPLSPIDGYEYESWFPLEFEAEKFESL